MFSELLVGALMAVAAPQNEGARADGRDIDIEIPSVEVQIPAIEIPSFDIELPGFAIVIPGFAFDGFELANFSVEIPELDIPGIYIDVGDWQDWDDRHFQDTEMDTTFSVNPKALLAIRNHAGVINIRTWQRNQIRLQARHSSDDKIKIFQSESSVSVKSESRHGHPDEVDYELTIPNGMAVDLWGFSTDISIDGVGNGVRVETMEGDIEVYNSGGEISIRSVEGDIVVAKSKGRFEVNGVASDITMTDVEGVIFAESIDGDIQLQVIGSTEVEAKTVDGDVSYDGQIRDGGRYRLSTHDGDVILTVPAGVNADVSVATFDGEFQAEFPVKLDRAEASRKFSFVLGKGGARIELNSFDGNILLIRK